LGSDYLHGLWLEQRFLICITGGSSAVARVVRLKKFDARPAWWALIEGRQPPEEVVMNPNPVLRHIRRTALLCDGGGLTDGQLLEQFLLKRDEDAFAGLLKRHGPMVLAVCRRVLGDAHDAEDACQATFLVLARKAGSVRSGATLGSWLHGVAYRTALKARTTMAKQRARERAASARTLDEAAAHENLEELLQLLDRALHALPEKYRLPVVLCELEGRSRKEVAGLLHLPEGTISSRLAYAKKLLAQKLSRRGAVLSAGAVTLVLAQGSASAGLPSSLLASTARAAVGHTLTAGAVSVHVATLVEGVIRAMLLSKLKGAWAVLAAVSIGAGAVGLSYRASASPPQQAGSAAHVTDDLEELRLELAALRKSLQTTRDRVKTLESEVQALRGQSGSGSEATTGGGTGSASMLPGMPGSMGMGGASKMPGIPGMPGMGGGMGMPNAAAGGFRSTRGFEQHGGEPADASKAMTEGMRRMMGGMGPSNPAGGQPPAAAEPENLPVRKRLYLSGSRAGGTDDPVTQAEALLRRLKDHPDDQKAADALEAAVRRLKDRTKPKPLPEVPQRQ
jgi:RNA polymerase sigma factor (sigma-70 family)